MDDDLRAYERRLQQSGQSYQLIPDDVFRQLGTYLQSELRRAEVIRSYAEERITGHMTPESLDRYDRRVKAAKDALGLLNLREPLELPLCNCYYAANPKSQHPSGFNCERCFNTGQLPLGVNPPDD